MRRPRSPWKSDKRIRRRVRDPVPDDPIPILSPEQYRFLRFLFDVAGGPETRAGAGACPETELEAERAVARIRSAMWLFEQSEPPNGGSATPERRPSKPR